MTSKIITNNLDLWTSALLTKSGAGRGSNGKLEAYGIKKLRELILELAVRGKLVPQDPNDEPASVLLRKIAKEKTRLIKEGRLKQEKLLPDIGDDEKTFELPLGWEWVRFGTIAQHNSGKTLDSGRNTGQLRDYITTSNLYWGRFDLAIVRQMPIADDELSKCSARKGDLLICEGGEAGRAAVWPYNQEVCFQNHVHRARFYGEEIDPYFVYRFFEKLNATGEIDQHRKGVGISNMSSKALALIVVPLPPHAEQHRIVAKVDELMALCDQLEQQQTDSLAAHQTLVETLLGTLTNTAVRAEPVEARPPTVHPSTSSGRTVEGRTEFDEAWTRIASHFDTLFTTEASIDQLKQSILQLAVMGKLVPQDPNDEPASVLLKRITEVKQQLVGAREIQQPKKLPSIGADAMPFWLPNGWEWAYVWDVAKIITSGSRDWAKHLSSSGAIFVTMGNLSRGDYRLRLDSLRYVNPPPGGEGSRTRLEANDLLISITGDVGNLGLIPEGFGEAYINQHTCLLRFMPDCQNRYFPELMRSPWAKFQFDAPQRGVKNSFRLSDVGEMLIPIPPLDEQHRIVVKVDELMALCDALKAHLADAQTTQLHLADAIVEQAVA